ncbi:hypothetical protein NDU88_000979 [Pleurodeles waltl]|uniref:Secreted protein n=1 Tax=Pleurodeles waltl TaxID=8319 RepID=A0AAV7VAF3_PLEWA|nr:hypothetical protein NDU88_000979 [Pleurodeles waltl]
MRLQRRCRAASQAARLFLFPFLIPWAAGRSITKERHGSQPSRGGRYVPDSDAAARHQPHSATDIKEQPPDRP